eukprot:9402563-Alexandrium_andersonii.AAC.1
MGLWGMRSGSSRNVFAPWCWRCRSDSRGIPLAAQSCSGLLSMRGSSLPDARSGTTEGPLRAPLRRAEPGRRLRVLGAGLKRCETDGRRPEPQR